MVNTTNYIPIYPPLTEATGLVTFSDKYTAGDLAFGLVLFSLAILLLTVIAMFWVARKKKRISRKGQMKIPGSTKKKVDKRVPDGGPNMYDTRINEWLEKE